MRTDGRTRLFQMYLKNAISRKQNPPRSLIIKSEKQFEVRNQLQRQFQSNNLECSQSPMSTNKLSLLQYGVRYSFMHGAWVGAGVSDAGRRR